MCGIAGAFGSVSRGDALELAQAMSCVLTHRGPDDAGDCALRTRDGVSAGAFAHRRLSILDLSASGHQPMIGAAGRYTIVFNGEIYNYRALRAELERDGARFASTSDTEVLLEGWARQGERFLPRLRGMFAFALWDRDEERGILARDRFGIKPLYVASGAKLTVFASEMRTLLSSGVVPALLDPRAIAAYLLYGAVPEPRTMVEGITCVPAGTVVELSWRGGTPTPSKPRPFGAPLVPAPGPAERDGGRAASLVRAALRDSVEHHLVSDVPVSFFLSGGIDSSAIVALASEVSDARLDTFTVTFGEREFSEAPPASAVARRFGTAHHEVPLAADDLLAMLPGALASMDQPSLDGLNTYVVSAAVRRAGHKVVLSGLGGDELFAGYPSFRRARLLAPMWRAARPARAALRVAGSMAGHALGTRVDKASLLLGGDDPARAAYLASRALFAGNGLRSLVGAARAAAAQQDALAPPPDGLSLLQRVSWYELTGYMRNTLLRDSDVFSMAHGLELRVPFVDVEVAAASVAVDDRLKVDGVVPKALLVRSVSDLLPREVWDRPKQGFQLPFARWLRGELRCEVAAVLEAPDRAQLVGLDSQAVRAAWRDFLTGRPGVNWSRVWAIFSLIRWAEHAGVGAAGPLNAAELSDREEAAD